MITPRAHQRGVIGIRGSRHHCIRRRGHARRGNRMRANPPRGDEDCCRAPISDPVQVACAADRYLGIQIMEREFQRIVRRFRIAFGKHRERRNPVPLPPLALRPRGAQQLVDVNLIHSSAGTPAAVVEHQAIDDYEGRQRDPQCDHDKEGCDQEILNTPRCRHHPIILPGSLPLRPAQSSPR